MTFETVICPSVGRFSLVVGGSKENKFHGESSASVFSPQEPLTDQSVNDTRRIRIYSGKDKHRQTLFVFFPV